MADLIKQLYKKNDSTTKIFPNIKSDNIPSLSVSLDKLSSDIQTILNSVPNKLNESLLNSLLVSIKTSLSSYGVNFNYSKISTNAWTTSFANVEQSFECDYAFDITEHFVKYQKIGNHYVGYLRIEFNEQVIAGEEILRLTNQTEFPIINTYMSGYRVLGNTITPCVITIDTDGILSANLGMDEFDILNIRLDWWVN